MSRNRLLSLVIAAAIAVISLGFTPTTTQAQKSTVIKFGDTITQDVAASFSPQTYTFTGKTGDLPVIFIQETATVEGKSPNLSITLTDTDKNSIDDDTTSGYSATLADLVLSDGTYTITVQRPKDNADKYTGKYYLSLIQPTELAVDTPVEAKLTAGKTVTNAYYAIHTSKPVNLELTTDPNAPISFYSYIEKFDPGRANYVDAAGLGSSPMFITSTVQLAATEGVYFIKLETSALSSDSAKTYAYKLSLTSAAQ